MSLIRFNRLLIQWTVIMRRQVLNLNNKPFINAIASFFFLFLRRDEKAFIYIFQLHIERVN